MDRYGGGGGGGGYRDHSSDRRGGGGGYRDQSSDRRGGGGGGYRDQSSDRRGGSGGGGFGGRGSSFRGRGSFSGGSFHKAAGGDQQRMPESVAHPAKPGQHQVYGTEGRRIDLVSNFYRLMSKDIAVYHYDVSIGKVRVKSGGRSSGGGGGDVSSSSDDQPMEQELDEKQKRLRELFIKKFADSIMAKFVADNGEVFKGVRYTYDGWKNFYTNQRLNLGSGELEQTLEMNICDRPATFLIKFQTVGRIPLGEAIDFYNGKSTTPVSDQVITVFDVIMRFVIGKSFATYQRKFFDMENVETSPRVRLVEFIQGFISAVRMTEFGLALNVNLKTSAIISRRFNALRDLVCEVINLRDPRELERLTRQQAFQATKMVRHLKIFTTHSRRTVDYTVDALIDRFPQDERFDWKGRVVTYADYFYEQYNIKLQRLPMVRVTKKNMQLPLELCNLKDGQFLNKSKIDGNTQREMLFKSTHTPNNYFHKVAGIIGRIKEADNERLLEEFGIDIEPKAARIEGRVLTAPLTTSSDPRSRLYKTARELPSWAVFVLDNVNYRPENIQQFVGPMMSSARSLGMNLPKPSITECINIADLTGVYNIFKNIHEKTNVKMVFIGIPVRSDTVSPADMYTMVKHCCNQRFGFLNQCFSAEKMVNLPGGYFQQFLLKVNAKMGGENNVIDPAIMSKLRFDPAITMLVGVDTINFSGTESGARCKVVGAVGSYSNNFTRYNASIRVQPAGESEAIVDLGGMITELLSQYEQANNNTLPKNIIIFRSGLSDGQFDIVHAEESKMIREAASSCKVVYIVVQKRHNARFALTQQDTSGRKPTYNVPSGTVVDRGIVNPTRRCFYLNSHFSPLGTSRPSKYTILSDGLNLSPDEVQKLCFYSCYNSCRTRGVISLPTPVRYADLLCQRTKNHLDALRNQDVEGQTFATASSGSFDMQAAVESAHRLNTMVVLHPEVKDKLFYC